MVYQIDKAIELLRDSGRLYYFVELIDVLERLVNEYEVCLQRTNRKEEIEALQEELQEKIAWRNVIKQLYVEHNLSPYMEHFCHLYRGTESFCIGDVIRVRRQMFGMTKEQLCEGICSVKTLTRIENKKARTQMPIVRELFKRLGLCAEYIRARVITSDYEVIALADKYVLYHNLEKIEVSI